MLEPNPSHALRDAIAKIKEICDESNGRSQYFPYGGSGYKASVTHYYESSTDVAGGAVQPGSVEDLQEIVKTIVDSRVPFAVKGGGHSTNPAFSSTGSNGIQIYMVRMNQIHIDTKEMLVRVGAGCLFEELYQALDPYHINIVGGSGISGVGVTGWMLGGGYSVKTSKHGLGVDNLASVKLVLPNGELAEASDSKNPDLFFALKGGCNNFGIVTELTLKAHHQGDFHDFTLTYRCYFNEVKIAVYRIIQKQDNKANIEVKFTHYSERGTDKVEVLLTVHCVYDGVYPSENPFAELESIPHDESGAPSLYRPKTTSFLHADLYRSYDNGTFDILSEIPKHSGDFSILEELPMPPMEGISQFPRGRWGNVVVDKFTPGIINAIQEYACEAAKEMKMHDGTRVIIGLWPFTESMFDNATDSAFPHEKGKPNCPIIVYFTWQNKKNDEYWIRTMKNTLKALEHVVHLERPSSDGLPHFINTALAEATTPDDLWRGNLQRLSTLRTKYDPEGVMNLTGGFRIPYHV